MLGNKEPQAAMSRGDASACSRCCRPESSSLHRSSVSTGLAQRGRAARRLARGARAASAIADASGSLHYAMLSPTLGLLLAFLALPALYVGWLSLHASTYGQGATFVGLANYAPDLRRPDLLARVLEHVLPRQRHRLRRARCSASASRCCCPGPVPAKPLVFAIILAPYAITESSGIVMWRYMLEPDVGMVTHVARAARPRPARLDAPTRCRR